MAGQLPASAFQNYDASVAASIAAGPTALYTVRVNDILPTQANLGFAEIGKKVSAYDLLTPSGLANDLLTGGSIEPVVIGPGGKLYLTNGHHTFTSLQQSIYGASNPLVYVNVIANYSNLTEAEFWAKMQASNFLLPLDNGVVTPVDPLTGSPIPSALSGMTNDPYRGLEYGILKNKSSKLFPTAANVTGAVGSSIPGLDKTAAYYSDFIWANAYRNANNGLGLPYLSPGDIALATQWNLNGANVTKLQQGGTDVTVAQLPGYILSNSLNISSVIDTNTVNSGVLDGNGGFTGLRGLDLGTVTIGTPASTTGFILQLGADRGGTVTLSGNNTYAGGTTILAGTLVVSSDTNLGAASPSNPAISSIHTADDVRAANGIVFNSLSEGNGTLQINSSMTFDRPIGVGGETAIINPNGNTVTLAGMIVSLDDNANGFSDLTIAKTGGGTVVLAPTAGSNPYFYGNWIISGGTLQASSDAALGNTTGPAYTIGQIILDGGTFQAGASFNSVRSLALTGSSTFDTNGFATSFAGSLTDVQRKLTVTNSSANDGAVTFGSLNISGTNTTNATGATSTLAFKAGGSGHTTVNLTNGVTRTDRSTLFIQPTSATSLGASEFVFSGVGTSSLINGLAPAWMISDSGGANAYDFLTYSPVKGYIKATYTQVGSGSSSGIRAATASDIVEQTGNATLAKNAAAYALKVDSGNTITATGFTITLGNGVDPAGLILGGSGSNTSGISGGTLAFGGSEGIIYARSTAGTTGNVISSTITGTNGLTLAGQGMLTLAAASPGLSGAVNIDSGTLNLTAANALLNVSRVNLSNVKSNPAAASLSMSASNAFASLNSGGSNSSITVSGANTVLTIGQIGNANAALNNLDSTISSTITDTDVATGSTAIVKAGTGMLDLSGAKLTLTTGSNIAVNAGTLRVGGSSFTNTNNIVTVGGSEVQFASNAGGMFAGNITGGGTMHLIGGTLQLTGTGNNYLGGTIVEQGSILDLTTANVSSGNSNIVNAGGLVVFDQATNGTYSGVISDGCQMMLACTTKLSGSLVKDDSTGGNTGNVTLGAVQAYTGGTFIEAGTLTLGLADVIFSSSGVDLGRVGGGATVTLALMADNTIKGLMSEKGNTTTVEINDKTLTINTANGQAWDFGGAITGSGGFVKSGAGVQILSGDSSGFTGATNIVNGTLVVAGSLGGSVDIWTGGRLQGIGTIGNTVVNGTIAPGNSIGTLNVAGNITFNPNSIYEVEVNAAGESDKILASGTATIDGGTVKVLAGTGNYAALTPYTILTANGGLSPNSAFDGATSNLAFLDPWLSYDTKNVYLTMVRNNIDFASIGITPNQIATGGGVESLGFGNPVYNAVLSLSAEQAQYAFDRLSGEIHASAKAALIEDSRFIRNAVNDRMRAAFDDGAGIGGTVVTYENGEPRAVAANTNRFAVWGQGFGSWGHTQGDGDAARLNRSTGGLFIGADAPVFDTWRFGAVAGFSRTTFNVKDRNSSGSSDNYDVGVYGGTHWGLAGGDLALRTGAAYAWHDISTSRGVMFPGFVDSLKGDYNAGTAQVFGELAYGLNAGSVQFEPFANLAYVSLQTDGFTERGGAAALTGASASTDATFSTLGLRGTAVFNFNGVGLIARGAVGWRHTFEDVTPLSTMRFAGGGAFTIGGVPIARDVAVLEAGLDYMLTSNATLGVSYNGQLGSDSTDQSVRANFDVRF
ncbi:autotransporter domain-containing protein [Hyphomicrobium sp. 2TAF46]|uniref:autotransporter domain-containing protein n=1 Tax=Hyphomicrobium sp. 2TAF46 TaxID=3233019 RepID=UPI003F92698A